MSTASQFQPISVRDYLAGERIAKRKHEYVDGVVYAMAGGTVQHSRIASNATGTLHAQLRGHKCEAFHSDMKVRVRLSRGTRFYYPDVSVVCQPNADRDSFHDAPVVIVEVISDSTRRTDEYEKREAYLSIDSLCAYVLVEQASAAVLVYRRGDSGFDREVYTGLDAIIPLPEIECQLALAELYQNVEFVPVVTDDELDES
ncbi:MAG: Uma2 family endonuclease [Planctomycetaceae bacterium]